MASGRYRWRTWLRVHLPYRFGIYRIVRKGTHDCGDHEWYREDVETLRCLHCAVGVKAPAEADDVLHWASTLDMVVNSVPEQEPGYRTSYVLKGPGELRDQVFIAGFNDSFHIFMRISDVFLVRDLGPQAPEIAGYADWARIAEAGDFLTGLPADTVEIQSMTVRIPATALT